MLDQVVVAMKADPVAALAKFNAGNAEFRDRDLYPFCIGADGRTTAHADAAQLGQPVHDLNDVEGKAFGQEILKVSEEGKINEVTYNWPEPGSRSAAEGKLCHQNCRSDMRSWLLQIVR